MVSRATHRLNTRKSVIKHSLILTLGDKVKPNTTIVTIGGNFGTAAGITKYFEIAGNSSSEILLSLGCMLIDSKELQFYVPYGGVVEDESTL
jgi:hypothetical protein